MNNNIFGSYWTKKFTDIFPTLNDFKAFIGYKATPNVSGTCAIEPVLTESELSTLYYLLYGKYGNNIIANFDETQWKYKIASIIFVNGIAWKKKVEIQKTLGNLDLNSADLLTGSTQIFNHSYNPSVAPTTATTDELTTINEQQANKFKRGKLDAYSMLFDLINNDVTTWFLDKFKNLFLVVLEQQKPLWYETEED